MRAYSMLAILAATGLSGCTFVPGAAPTAYEIEHSARPDESTGYLLRKLDTAALAILLQTVSTNLSATFHDAKPTSDVRIGAGDTLQISIWEAGGEGLFGQGTTGVGAHNATFQPVTVGQDGFVTIPFAGRVKAGGKSPDEIGKQIEAALKDRALDPQVMVLVSSAAANVATIGGDVNQPVIRTLDLRGNRLLDAIAAAGGSKFPAYESNLRLSRHGKSVTVPLQQIVDNTAENIFVQPGDDIYVTRQPRTFTVFGGVNHVGQFNFGSPKLSLADGISMSGGLVDLETDASGIFLFRTLHKDQAIALFPDAKLPGDEDVPVIFRVDLSEAGGYFLAQQTPLQDKDLILATNAKGTQLLKLFGIARAVTAPIGDVKGNLRAN